MQFGYEGADSSMAGQLHLNHQDEIAGLCDLPLHENHTIVAAHFFGSEKTLLISADDGEQNFIPRDSTGRAHAENIDGNLNVGGEREVVRSYSQGQVLAFLIFVTRQALTTTARKVRRQGRAISTHLASKEQKGEERGAGRGARHLDSHNIFKEVTGAHKQGTWLAHRKSQVHITADPMQWVPQTQQS